MRATLCIWMIVLLCSCGREPSFDERYSETANTIRARGQEIDNSMNQVSTINESRAAADASRTSSREAP